MFDNLKQKKISKMEHNKIIFFKDKKKIMIIPIGEWILKKDNLLKKINKKRYDNNNFFLTEITKSIKKTKLYFKNIIKNKKTCLFVICSKKSCYDGIIGLNKSGKKLEIYFVLKLNKTPYMKISLKKMILWAKRKYNINEFIVRVLSNNLAAKKLYFKCGFKDYRNNFLKVRLLKGLKNHITCKRKEANVKYKYQTLSLTL